MLVESERLYKNKLGRERIFERRQSYITNGYSTFQSATFASLQRFHQILWSLFGCRITQVFEKPDSLI